MPLKRILVKYFADAKCEISTVALVKFSAQAESEMKSTHRRSDFTRRRRISHREAVFYPSARVDFTEKRTCFRKCVFLVRQKGLEPPTFWFVAKHSIQLSYWRIALSALDYSSTPLLKMQAFFSKTVKYFAARQRLTPSRISECPAPRSQARSTARPASWC